MEFVEHDICGTRRSFHYLLKFNNGQTICLNKTARYWACSLTCYTCGDEFIGMSVYPIARTETCACECRDIFEKISESYYAKTNSCIIKSRCIVFCIPCHCIIMKISQFSKIHCLPPIQSIMKHNLIGILAYCESKTQIDHLRILDDPNWKSHECHKCLPVDIRLIITEYYISLCKKPIIRFPLLT